MHSVLTQEECAALKLRQLYASSGYKFYRMRRFEEYDFYAGKKDFLTSSAILTFTDLNGKLMALRPDVTLSLIKHAPSGKYYYDEKVYRVPKNADTFREISQCGVECTGDFDLQEVLSLASQSLEAVSEGRRHVLDVADAGKVSRLLPREKHDDVLKCLAAKNIHGLKDLGVPDELISLVQHEDHDGIIRTDYSAVTTISYYTGLVFKGYIEGIADAVLSGGQYCVDGKKGAGFAVYLDELEVLSRD